jgi:HlyD family secretion protein
VTIKNRRFFVNNYFCRILSQFLLKNRNCNFIEQVTKFCEYYHQKGIEAIKASLKALEASKTQIEAVLDELTLRSSIEGVVVEKIANQGEVVGAGSVVATLLDPSSLYLKIFVDTKQNGNLQIGNDAVIFLDGKPNEPIAAKVVRIEQKAEFTPKEVSVPSDRIQRVFALHVKPLSPQATLKLGIPAVGVVSMDGKGLPKSLSNVPE